MNFDLLRSSTPKREKLSTALLYMYTYHVSVYCLVLLCCYGKKIYYTSNNMQQLWKSLNMNTTNTYQFCYKTTTVMQPLRSHIIYNRCEWYNHCRVLAFAFLLQKYWIHNKLPSFYNCIICHIFSCAGQTNTRTNGHTIRRTSAEQSNVGLAHAHPQLSLMYHITIMQS